VWTLEGCSIGGQPDGLLEPHLGGSHTYGSIPQSERERERERGRERAGERGRERE